MWPCASGVSLCVCSERETQGARGLGVGPWGAHWTPVTCKLINMPLSVTAQLWSLPHCWPDLLSHALWRGTFGTEGEWPDHTHGSDPQPAGPSEVKGWAFCHIITLRRPVSRWKQLLFLSTMTRRLQSALFTGKSEAVLFFWDTADPNFRMQRSNSSSQIYAMILMFHSYEAGVFQILYFNVTPQQQMIVHGWVVEPQLIEDINSTLGLKFMVSKQQLWCSNVWNSRADECEEGCSCLLGYLWCLLAPLQWKTTQWMLV